MVGIDLKLPNDYLTNQNELFFLRLHLYTNLYSVEKNCTTYQDNLCVSLEDNMINLMKTSAFQAHAAAL